MILDWIRQQKLLSVEELRQGQEEYLGLDVSQKEELWQELHDYFIKAPLSMDRRLWLSYFRWYVELTWSSLYSKSEEIVSSVVFPRQLLMAVLIGYDPIAELFQYLNLHPFDQESMPGFYAKLRDGVLKSGALMGIARGREVTCAEMVRELTVLKQTKDTLRLAEFISRLKDVLYPKSEPELPRYLTQDPDKAVGALLTTLNFFMDVEPEGIWDMTRLAYHPEDFAFEEDAALATSSTSSSANAATPKSSSPPSPKPSLASSAPKPVPPLAAYYPPEKSLDSTRAPLALPKAEARAEVEETSGVTEEKTPSFAEIRTMVEAVFPPSTDNEKYLSNILEMLSTLATRYNDESIRDLYYFNAETGKFEWNT
jgi:hypothetical protein